MTLPRSGSSLSCVSIRRFSGSSLRVIPTLGALVLSSSLASCQKHSDETRAVDGSIVFASACARCHGTDGCGAMATNPVGTPRRLCDPAFQSSVTDDQIGQTIRKGKGMMPGFGDDYNEEQVKALVRYVRTLKAGK